MLKSLIYKMRIECTSSQIMNYWKKSIWIFYDLEFVLFDWFEIRLGTLFLINCKWKSSVKMQFEFNISLLGHGKKYYAKIGVLCCAIGRNWYWWILGRWDLRGLTIACRFHVIIQKIKFKSFPLSLQLHWKSNFDDPKIQSDNYRRLLTAKTITFQLQKLKISIQNPTKD